MSEQRVKTRVLCEHCGTIRDLYQECETCTKKGTIRNPAFVAELEKMRATHESKNADYAADDNPYSNFEYAAKVAEGFTDPVDKVFATIIGIKMARIQQLKAGKTPNNESLEDTYHDLAVYSTIWSAYQKRTAAPIEDREHYLPGTLSTILTPEERRVFGHKQNRPRCYIAGPMTGKPDDNRPAFYKAEKEARELGFRPINPAGLGQGGDFIRRDIEIILDLDTEKDAVYMLKGWGDSIGAKAEHDLALWRGLRIIYQTPVVRSEGGGGC